MTDLGRIESELRNGDELLHQDGHALGPTLLDFWRWSASDIVSNATRGILAEYLVASAIGAAGGTREEWAMWDLTAPDGTRLEIKSAAYVQTWQQERLSKVSFGCAKTQAYDPLTNQPQGEPCRHADVYVFALLQHEDQATLDPLNVSQWAFFIVPTASLDGRTRSQHSITVPSLRTLVGESVGYSELEQAIRAAARIQLGSDGLMGTSNNGIQTDNASGCR